MLDLPINADDTMDYALKKHGTTIKNVVAGIREEASNFKHPKGISKAGMKVASIPEDIIDAFCHSHGRLCWQDPQFVLWFLKKYPHFKYVPSVTWTTSRF